MKNPFNSDKYLSASLGLIRHIDKNGIESVSEYCVMTGLPLIVALKFIIENRSEHTEYCETKIAIINKFYGYEE